MVNFVTIGHNGEHLVPDDEMTEHCPYDFCECEPVYRPVAGRWLWIHNQNPEKQLFEQAEAIRQVTSIQLWREIEGKKLKFEVMPFPKGFQGAIWPQPAEGHPHVTGS